MANLLPVVDPFETIARYCTRYALVARKGAGLPFTKMQHTVRTIRLLLLCMTNLVHRDYASRLEDKIEGFSGADCCHFGCLMQILCI